MARRESDTTSKALHFGSAVLPEGEVAFFG